MKRFCYAKNTWFAGAAALAALSWAVNQSQAAEETTTPTVVVTATKIPTPIGSVGSSVTVIDSAEIDRKGYKTLSDALKTVPGVSVRQSGGQGHQTSVFIRGAESRHVLFLINGLDVNDPSGSGAVYDPAHLPLDQVERIEIIRGPQSVLYGSDAVGGVINVITKEGSGDWTATASAEGGTLGTYKTAAGAGGQFGRITGRLDASWLETGGHNISLTGNENDGYENLGLSGTLGAEITDNLDARLFGQYVWSSSDGDAFGFDDPTRFTERDQVFLKGEIRGTFFDEFWDLKLTGGLSDQEIDNITGGMFPSTNTFIGRIYEAGLQNDLHIHEGGILTLGVEADIESGENFGSATTGFDEGLHTVSYLAQYQFEFWDRLSGTIGGRLDDNSVFGTQTTWRVAISYLIAETDTRLRGSVATGFNAPTLIDLFGFIPPEPIFDFDGFVGNPNLQPEKSFSWEIGVEQSLFEDRLIVGLTYFFNDFDNLINPFFDAVPDDGVPATAININAAETHGLEVTLSAIPVDEVEINASYTYLRTRDLATGLPLLRRPTHEFSGEVVVYPIDELQIASEVHYVGERADIDLIGFPATSDDFVVVNLAGEYRIDDNVTVFARVENLLDSDIQDPFGFAQPGREVFGGIKVVLP